MARGRDILSRLGPAARAQAEAQLAANAAPVFEKRGRIQRSPREERTTDGRVFDSKWEMQTYRMLRDELGLGAFTLQPGYVLQEAFTLPGGRKVRAITYTADFLVREGDSEWVVDAKGMETERFKLNEKMFMFRYRRPIIKLRTVREVRAFIDEVVAARKLRAAS